VHDVRAGDVPRVVGLRRLPGHGTGGRMQGGAAHDGGGVVVGGGEQVEVVPLREGQAELLHHVEDEHVPGGHLQAIQGAEVVVLVVGQLEHDRLVEVEGPDVAVEDLAAG